MTTEETIEALAPELARPRPRPVRPAKKWRMERYYGPLMLAAVLGAIYSLVYCCADKPVHVLRDRGALTEGKVTALDVHHGKTTIYTLGYSFTDGSGGVHENSSDISQTTFEALEEGNPIDVTYLPSDPGLSRPMRISDEVVAGTDQDLAILGWFLGLFGLIVIALLERDARLHWWLARNGQPIVAEVVKRNSYTGKGGTGYFVTYEFVDARRQTQRRKIQVPRAVYEAVPEGQGLVVLYDPERPKRSLPYANLAVRPIG